MKANRENYYNLELLWGFFQQKLQYFFFSYITHFLKIDKRLQYSQNFNYRTGMAPGMREVLRIVNAGPRCQRQALESVKTKGTGEGGGISSWGKGCYWFLVGVYWLLGAVVLWGQPGQRLRVDVVVTSKEGPSCSGVLDSQTASLSLRKVRREGITVTRKEKVVNKAHGYIWILTH